jgi:hypothetical protein
MRYNDEKGMLDRTYLLDMLETFTRGHRHEHDDPPQQLAQQR